MAEQNFIQWKDKKAFTQPTGLTVLGTSNLLVAGYAGTLVLNEDSTDLGRIVAVPMVKDNPAGVSVRGSPTRRRTVWVDLDCSEM